MALTPLEQRIAKQVDKIPIPEVALRFGVKIEPDQNMVCPFPGHLHTNNTPSFRYYPRTNTMNCFGSCHAAGGTFNFLRAMLNSDNKAAIEYAKNVLHIRVTSLAKSFANLAKSLAEEKSIEEEIPLNIKIFKEQDKVQNLEAYKNAAQAYEVMLLLEASEFDTSAQKTQLLNKLIEKNKAYE